jgi:hypothetical protein
MIFELDEASHTISFKNNVTVKEVLTVCDRWKLELTKWKVKGYEDNQEPS